MQSVRCGPAVPRCAQLLRALWATRRPLFTAWAGRASTRQVRDVAFLLAPGSCGKTCVLPSCRRSAILLPASDEAWAVSPRRRQTSTPQSKRCCRRAERSTERIRGSGALQRPNCVEPSQMKMISFELGCSDRHLRFMPQHFFPPEKLV